MMNKMTIWNTEQLLLLPSSFVLLQYLFRFSENPIKRTTQTNTNKLRRTNRATQLKLKPFKPARHMAHISHLSTTSGLQLDSPHTTSCLFLKIM